MYLIMLEYSVESKGLIGLCITLRIPNMVPLDRIGRLYFYKMKIKATRASFFYGYQLVIKFLINHD
jgi:hypothetical protein